MDSITCGVIVQKNVYKWTQTTVNKELKSITSEKYTSMQLNSVFLHSNSVNESNKIMQLSKIGAWSRLGGCG